MAQIIKQPETFIAVPETEISKGQEMRIMDVAIFGPLMIMSAMNKEPPELLRLAMLGIGIGTIVYNGWNFLKNMNNV